MSDFDRWLDQMTAEVVGQKAPELACLRCEDGGWEAFPLPGGGHRFEECGGCGNPEGHLSP